MKNQVIILLLSLLTLMATACKKVAKDGSTNDGPYYFTEEKEHDLLTRKAKCEKNPNMIFDPKSELCVDRLAKEIEACKSPKVWDETTRTCKAPTAGLALSEDEKSEIEACQMKKTFKWSPTAHQCIEDTEAAQALREKMCRSKGHVLVGDVCVEPESVPTNAKTQPN